MSYIIHNETDLERDSLLLLLLFSVVNYPRHFEGMEEYDKWIKKVNYCGKPYKIIKKRNRATEVYTIQIDDEA